eukprot:TRINITY_DN25886_c0_g1_i1.p1 TRINITY_DN25886_c0_g1~~TRINITY_DN25886_c0_g1_i1.p1  ORF type:complete len:369 (+),score=71.59 TRINITY_DN25886_c0_g1_i1:89-1195(+)
MQYYLNVDGPASDAENAEKQQLQTPADLKAVEPSRSYLFQLTVGALRAGAWSVPWNLDSLRFLCDSAVPSAFLQADVRHEAFVADLGGGSTLEAEWVIPTPGYSWLSWREWPRPESFDRVVLYMHGGAYVLCTPGALRGITYNLASALGAPVFAPVYRRPPEHPAPAQVEDAIAAYAYLRRTMPHAEVVFAGESAGGGIMAATLLQLRLEPKLPWPSCAVLVSPWADVGEDGLRHASLENESRDYLPAELVSWIARQARGDVDHNDWRISPTYADGPLDSLPPVMVVYGSSELLCAQVENFCASWISNSAPLQARCVSGGVHAPILFAFCDEEAQRALEDIAIFVRANSCRVESLKDGANLLAVDPSP